MSGADVAARDLAGKLMTFMETGVPPAGLFTPDVFCDFTMPQWRLQAQGIEDVTALRKAGHQGPSSVPRSRFDLTAAGFVLEVRGAVGRRWRVLVLPGDDQGRRRRGVGLADLGVLHGRLGSPAGPQAR